MAMLGSNQAELLFTSRCQTLKRHIKEHSEGPQGEHRLLEAQGVGEP